VFLGNPTKRYNAFMGVRLFARYFICGLQDEDKKRRALYRFGEKWGLVKVLIL
jgi:hypothetical protein